MSERQPDRLVVVAGDDDDRLVDALRDARDDAAERDAPVDVTVVVGTDERAATARTVVADVALPDAVSVTTVVDRDPTGFVRDRAATARVGRVLVDPAVVDPNAAGDGGAFADLDVAVERLAADRDVRRRPLVHSRGLAGFVLTFVLSYGFYLLLGDPTDPFDVVTGAVTAGVVAVALSSVVLETEPSASTVLVRSLRATAFLPYLLAEVVRANLEVAAVTLDPSLPIDPQLIEYEPGTSSPFEQAVLANAITLTPGTVTVDADEDGLLVHALTAETRAGLESGSLARAVAWVFHGSGRG